MNNLKITLSSLSMDLNRVALGLHRDSKVMAERFFQEALARKAEVDLLSVPLYIRKILIALENKNGNLDKHFAEDALMYSVLLENYSVRITE